MGSTAAHQDLVKQILLYLSSVDKCRAWENVTGTGYTMDLSRIISFGLKGSADILGCWDGKFIAIEVKTGNAVQTKQQRMFEQMINHCGGLYLVARCLEDVKEKINQTKRR